MYVPSYQMHNVLNVYSNQLRQNMVSEGKSKVPAKPPSDRIHLSPEGKRQATIEKVSRDILDKISRYDSLNESRQRNPDYENINSDTAAIPRERKNKEFVFNL